MVPFATCCHSVICKYFLFNFQAIFVCVNVTWCVIGFHDNQNYINDDTSGPILDFQIFFLLELNTENGVKTAFSDWSLQNCKIRCKVVSV